MVKNALIAAMLTIAMASTAHATRPQEGDIQIIAGAWSKHENDTYKCPAGRCEYRERHNAVGVEYTYYKSKGAREILTAAKMNDSFGESGGYAGAARLWTLYESSWLAAEVGFFAGFVKHSAVTDGRPTPMILPVGTISAGPVGLNLSYLHGKSGMNDVAAVEFKFSLPF